MPSIVSLNLLCCFLGVAQGFLPLLEWSRVTGCYLDTVQCVRPLHQGADDDDDSSWPPVMGKMVEDSDHEDTDLVSTAKHLQETQKRLEQQQQQIDELIQLMRQQVVPATTSTTTNTPATLTPLKVMLFIDGTWLYYSLYEREAELCPITREHGPGWPLRYYVDWAALPRLLCQALQQQQGWSADGTDQPASRGIEMVRVCVFTSYKADTHPTTYRYRLFEDMKAANYDVHMMETVGKSEKCVDIQLAVEMLHYATVPGAYDIALLLSGDKDFLPAMIRTRQKGRQVGLVSMRRGCNRALYETTSVKDYNVIWLDDYVKELVKLRGPDELLLVDDLQLSVFGFMKILVDFVEMSGMERVSSRDVGRYLKSLPFGDGSSVSDELKRCFGGLKVFLAAANAFVLQSRSEESIKEDPTDSAYFISLKPDIKARLLEEAKQTTFTQAEKDFFNSYTLSALEDKTAYGHTMLIDKRETPTSVEQATARPVHKGNKLDLPADLVRDYSECTLAELRERCRERGLHVSGTKAVLLERVQQDVNEQVALLRAEFDERSKRSHQGHGPGNGTVNGQSFDETASHLKDMIIEYLHARGGEASSRNVGRYLAANKPYKKVASVSHGSQRRESALQELKANYGSLATFVNRYPDTFEVAFNEDEKEFSILLWQGVGATAL